MHDRHGMTAIDEVKDDGTADEPRAAQHQNPHLRAPGAHALHSCAHPSRSSVAQRPRCPPEAATGGGSSDSADPAPAGSFERVRLSTTRAPGWIDIRAGYRALLEQEMGQEAPQSPADP